MDAADGSSGWMAAHHHRQLGLLDATTGGALVLNCAMLALACWAFSFVVGEMADDADDGIGAALAPLVISPVVLLLLLLLPLRASRDSRYYLGGTPIPRTLETKPHDTPDERLREVGQ